MAYEKRTWQDGDAVTSAKLNNIERGVEEVNSEYVKTTWQAGDIVTAEKLNNIENGIENASGGGGSGDYPTITATYHDDTQQLLLMQ